MKKLIVAFLGVAAAITAGAANYEWIGGSSIDWTDGNNFSNTAAKVTGPVIGVVPGAGDTVRIPENTVAKLVSTDYDSVDVVNRLNNVRPFGTNSWFEVNVPNPGDYLAVTAMVRYTSGNMASCALHGGLIKSGAGQLELVGSNSTGTETHCCKMRVLEGALRLFPNAKKNTYYKYIMSIFVDEGATCYLPYESDGANITFVYAYDISGTGTFAYDAPHSTSSYICLRQKPIANWPDEIKFEGRLTGNITVVTETTFVPGVNNLMSGQGYVRVGGATGTYPAGPRVDITTFGMTGNAVPSSIGANSIRFFGYATDTATYNYEDSGAIRYIGSGETTDKNILLDGNSQYPDFIDAGPNGGLVLAGTIAASSGASTGAQTGYRLILTGDNTKPAAITGEIANGTLSGSGEVSAITNITKRGSGMWKFAPSNIATWPGELWVEEGTIGFEALPTNRVVLKEGTVLEYTGSSDGKLSGCRIAASGNVTIRNKSGHEVDISGISALNGGATVTVESAEGSKIILRDVKDGSGKLSVVTSGAGDVVLDGVQDFTGSLEIKGGRATVMRPQYTYYRFTFKEMWGSSYLTYAGLFELGFWDADKTRMGSELFYDDSVSRKDAKDLAEGELSFAPEYKVNGWYASAPVNGGSRAVCNPTTWFNGKAEMFACCVKLNNYSDWQQPVASKPDTWQMYAFRFPRSRKPVRYYDYCTRWQGSFCGVRRASLEASTDGISWDLVDDRVSSASAVDNKYHWEYAGTSFTSDYEANVAAYDCAGAYPVPAAPARSEWPKCLDRVSSVMVSKGAKLIADGDFTLDRITVDCGADGSGSYRDFAIAEEGRLDLVNIDGLGNDKTLPIDLSGATGGENIVNWKVYVDGTERSWKFIVLPDGRIRIARTGVLIIAE